MPGSLNGKAGLEYTSMLAFKFLLGNILKNVEALQKVLLSS